MPSIFFFIPQESSIMKVLDFFKTEFQTKKIEMKQEKTYLPGRTDGSQALPAWWRTLPAGRCARTCTPPCLWSAAAPTSSGTDFCSGRQSAASSRCHRSAAHKTQLFEERSEERTRSQELHRSCFSWDFPSDCWMFFVRLANKTKSRTAFIDLQWRPVMDGCFDTSWIVSVWPNKRIWTYSKCYFKVFNFLKSNFKKDCLLMLTCTFTCTSSFTALLHMVRGWNICAQITQMCLHTRPPQI